MKIIRTLLIIALTPFALFVGVSGCTMIVAKSVVRSFQTETALAPIARPLDARHAFTDGAARTVACDLPAICLGRRL